MVCARVSGGPSPPRSALLACPSVAAGLAHYRGGALVALLPDAGDGRPALALVAGEDLEYGEVAAAGASSLAQAALAAIAPAQALLPSGGARTRPLVGGCVANPLAVSAPRGVACVLTADGSRATVYDLEEDDDGDDDGGGGGGDDGLSEPGTPGASPRDD